MFENFLCAIARIRGAIGKSPAVSSCAFGVLLLTIGASAIHAQSPIAATPNYMSFPAQAVGTASDPVMVTLTNNGNDEVRVTSVRLSSPQFSFSGPALPYALSAGQSMSGTVTFAPSFAGQVGGLLTFRLGALLRTSIELSGSAVDQGAQSAGPPASDSIPPAIVSNPTSQIVIAGQTATFVFAASGAEPLSYQWNMNGSPIPGATSPWYTTDPTTTANSGETFNVTVSNSAGSVTSNSATLTVNAMTKLLTASPSSLNFGGLVVGGSLIQTVTLTDIGNSNVTVANVTISGADFTPVGVSAGQIIPPGSTATMIVTFIPLVNTGLSGSITITSDATNSPITVSLSGSGTQSGSYSVTVTWTPSVSQSVVGYNVYRATTPGGESQTTPINGAALVPGEAYVDPNVVDGATYYYVVTAVDSSGAESGDSNEASAAIP
ncbi:MAG: choice-of-anchor D domain-containing protein [Candidatus Acidiferrales bacterium]